MKKAVWGSLAVAAVVLAGVPAQACCHKKGGCCEPCCPAPVCCEAPCVQPTVTWVEKTVTACRPEWRERDVTCTVNRVVPRVEVIPQQCTVMVPVWTEQQRVCTEYTQVPRQVQKQVTSCRMVPVCVTDPCTGCTHVCCKPETVVHTVTCTVMECVPVQRAFTVKVCSFKPEVRTTEVRRVVCDVKPETVVHKERYCVMVPYQTTVKVPVCTFTPVACCH